MSRKTFRQRNAPADPPTSAPSPVVVDPPPSPADPAPGRPSDDDIRTLAYFRWEQAGCPDGDGCEFWYSAENAVRAAGQAK